MFLILSPSTTSYTLLAYLSFKTHSHLSLLSLSILSINIPVIKAWRFRHTFLGGLLWLSDQANVWNASLAYPYLLPTWPSGISPQVTITSPVPSSVPSKLFSADPLLTDAASAAVTQNFFAKSLMVNIKYHASILYYLTSFQYQNIISLEIIVLLKKLNQFLHNSCTHASINLILENWAVSQFPHFPYSSVPMDSLISLAFFPSFLLTEVISHLYSSSTLWTSVTPHNSSHRDHKLFILGFPSQCL